MRSLYLGIAVSMAVTLLCSLFVFIEISDRVERKYLNPVFEVMDQLELESAGQRPKFRRPSRGLELHAKAEWDVRHFTLPGGPEGCGYCLGRKPPKSVTLPPLSKSRGIVNGQFVVRIGPPTTSIGLSP